MNKHQRPAAAASPAAGDAGPDLAGLGAALGAASVDGGAGVTDDPFHGLRVLVVEDVAVLAWLAEEMLEALGCEVVGSAARVSAALALIAASRVDVALLDVNLRDETSYAVADALREKRVPFAFVTAFGRERLSARHRSVPLLGKPYREADLRRVLAETLALGT